MKPKFTRIGDCVQFHDVRVRKALTRIGLNRRIEEIQTMACKMSQIIEAGLAAFRKVKNFGQHSFGILASAMTKEERRRFFDANRIFKDLDLR